PRSAAADVPILKPEVDFFPSHLFELSRNEHPWWVAYVRSRQEKGLARHLAGHGVGFYLPQAEKRTRSACKRSSGASGNCSRRERRSSPILISGSEMRSRSWTARSGDGPGRCCA